MLHSPRPAWRTKIVAAKAAAFLMMSAQEIQETEVERAARRARKLALRAQRLKRARLIFKMYDDGATVSEISAVVGWGAQWIRKSAQRSGVAFYATDSRVRRAVKLTIERESALRRMAASLGIEPRRALHDLVALALDDDAAIARRLLHVKRSVP